MKFTDYILMFLFGFIILFTGLNYKTQINAQASVMESKYLTYAKSAALDAIKFAEPYKDEGIFTTEKTRKEVVDAYMRSLAYSFNAKDTTVEDEIPLYVPMVCLIDNNGYYLAYPESYAQTGAYTGIGTVITPINVWAETFGKYEVRYYLNSYVTVTDTGKKISRSGAPVEVFEFFERPSELLFLTSENELNNRKLPIITDKIVTDMEYLIGEHNSFYEEYGLSYTVELPDAAGADFARAIENPAVIGFLQGKLHENGDKMISLYSMAGSHILLTTPCYLTEDTVYHKDENCRELKRLGDYTDILYSDTEAAKAGFYPCPVCTD